MEPSIGWSKFSSEATEVPKRSRCSTTKTLLFNCLLRLSLTKDAEPALDPRSLATAGEARAPLRGELLDPGISTVKERSRQKSSWDGQDNTCPETHTKIVNTAAASAPANRKLLLVEHVAREVPPRQPVVSWSQPFCRR
jgi:hypothetical protein